MISETVIPDSLTEKRKTTQDPISDCVIYPGAAVRQYRAMLTTAELLARLDERGVKNSQIARALDLTPSRITELRKGERALKHDEAVRLVEAFDLESEPNHRPTPLPAPVSRLIVRYLAAELGVPLPEADKRLLELSEDVRAFAEFVTDPKVRQSVEAAEAFFQAMRLRRPTVPTGGPGRIDPELAN